MDPAQSGRGYRLSSWPIGVIIHRAVTERADDPGCEAGRKAGTLIGMPMRQDCKFFESRTYPSGDTVRKCDLDLAPEAPWRCPADCKAFTPRRADVNWQHGTLITPPTPTEPASVTAGDESVAKLLDEAEDIISSAAPSMIADFEAERKKREGSRTESVKRRFGKRPPKSGMSWAEKLRARYRDGKDGR